VAGPVEVVKGMLDKDGFIGIVLALAVVIVGRLIMFD
jgi:hypothetical protein